MTCIVGMCRPDAVLLCADSRSMWGQEIVTDESEKIIRAGNWALALAGTKRLNNVVAEAAEEWGLQTDIGGVVRALAAALRADDWDGAAPDGRGPRDRAVTALVAGPTGLWLVTGDLTYCAIPEGRVMGIGCGGEVATGAADALLGEGYLAADALQRAVAIAIARQAACGGDIRLHAIPRRALSLAEAAA